MKTVFMALIIMFGLTTCSDIQITFLSGECGIEVSEHCNNIRGLSDLISFVYAAMGVLLASAIVFTVLIKKSSDSSNN